MHLVLSGGGIKRVLPRMALKLINIYYSQLLSAVLLLLRLWDRGTKEMDNERSSQGTSAPLLPLLQRFQGIHGSKEEPVPEEELEVRTLNCNLFCRTIAGVHRRPAINRPVLLFQILSAPLSPNESFLRYLNLPQDNELAIDLRQTAVVIMAHLDRLAVPCSPPPCSSPTSSKVPPPPLSYFFKRLKNVNSDCSLMADSDRV